jgi:class 3 adenylate cyclase/tetratricopeptide (TPR) repeat protein
LTRGGSLTCPSCGSANEAGRKFCGECATALARACPSCGTANPPTVTFCGECGTALTDAAPASAPSPATVAPGAERRLVSVLFADLVGFTAASEGRDAEETRELLSRYFDVSRGIIERYGGTVEKFIGDAVMAVWGTPIATEDDAERAVRAALELVSAIPELHPALQARAGVLTGEAAVTIGATSEGMVAGDLVNTASRVQSVADPGVVLVGESTRRATEAAIAYEDAGVHDLKGKTEPVPLFRALRVVASVGGEGRSVGLEAPFVGRDAQLRLLKELFHATVDERHARLLSVVGVAGVGKSRLSWEFEKYADGLAQRVWWHRGRCLAYGDGVAYWALAEMVRGRIGVSEDEDAQTVAERLRTTLAEHFDDGDERAWIEQRLRPLVGPAEQTGALDREDLFPAWRRFFERLAEQLPVVLVFEDLHWADAGLIAFVEHLLDWSRGHPVFVVTLARPEVAERHPGFPGATRRATTMPLEPLTDEAMAELLRGLVPGLPDDVSSRIRERADGIPLYAVETVRMLLDRGLLEQVGSEYGITGPIEALEVPETLHALIASRLDSLTEDERRVLQDASVLGKTFTRRGVAALSGLDEEAVQPVLTTLLRKEILYLETDPRSAERGQYGFLQALVQRVAYDMLSRRERRSRHLAAAAFLARESGIDPSEIAEVIAAHYRDALEADEHAADVDAVRLEACSWYVRAAERALALAAPAEAQRAFVRAAALVDDDVERARLQQRAGDAARMASDLRGAERHLSAAMEGLRSSGQTREEAEAAVKLAEILLYEGRMEDAASLMAGALQVFETAGDEAAEAMVSAQMGRFLFFQGEHERALQHVERALEIGERIKLPAAVSQALNTKALLLRDRPYESLALMRGAFEIARENELHEPLERAYVNLPYLLWITGASSRDAQAVSRDGLAYSRRRGDREGELLHVSQLCGALYEEGRWDELEQLAAELPEEALHRVGNTIAFQLPAYLALIAYHRGEPRVSADLMADWAALERSSDIGYEACRSAAKAIVALARGRFEEVLDLARARLDAVAGTGDLETHLELANLATTDADSAARLERLLELADAADTPKPPSTVAVIAYMRAKAAALRGQEPDFDRAIARIRESDRRLLLGMALVEQAAWLAESDRADEAAPLLDEAREIFEPLRATPWLERVDSARALAEVGA